MPVINLSTIRSKSTPLSPAELVEAAVLADLALVVVVVTRLTPLSDLTQVLGCIPFAILAMRNRIRVVGMGFFIALILTFLLAGYGEAFRVIIMVVWGGVTGKAIRKGWGWIRSALWSLVLGWPVVVAFSLGLLKILPKYRELWIEKTRIQWQGFSRILQTVLPNSWVDKMGSGIEWGLANWWISLPLLELVVSLWMVFIVRRLAWPISERVEQSFPSPDIKTTERVQLEDETADSNIKPAPVPIVISNQAIRSGNKNLYQVEQLSIQPGEFIAITGENGAGKSTLLHTLAGLQHSVSLIETRSIGLGKFNGTALIGQRPESQVLGARVIDDLRWRPFDENEASQLETHESEALAQTGLSGFELRETTTLSGGELQRLAIAGAILRQPQLVLSDESTSMLAPEGRTQIINLLRQLADDGAVVLHVTHLSNELSVADRVLHIVDKKLVEL